MELTDKKKVEISMIGSDGNMSVVGLFQIIQDAVTDLLCLHKLDAPTLRDEYNAIWLFVKTKAKLFKKLCCQEAFTIHAFFSYISLAKMHIDVQITNAGGETAMYSRTEICALDIEKQAIRRLPTVGVDTSMPTRSENTDIEFTRFEETDLPLTDSIRVSSTSIDMSHHTNNAEYVRIIMNTFSIAETEAMSIKDMELFYTGQSYENDVLNIRKDDAGNERRIILEKDGHPVFKCKIACA